MVTTEESFEALLAWLGPNREAGGEKYEVIRGGLIRIFVSTGFSDAESLADETIERVTKRLPEIRDGYVGEPARYFHGVARHVLQEARRQKEVATDLTLLPMRPEENKSHLYECLDRCLKFLPDNKRELILDYYLYDGHDKIEHHRHMADELVITENALRIRAHHIRGKLEKCVLQCAESLETKQNLPVSA